MNKLLEIKNRAVKFYGEHQSYLFPIVKFVIAFAAFVTIDLNIGYMTQISSILIALLLALICTIIPINGIIWIGSIMILMDMYALSIEVAATTLVLFLVIYFIYFRFAPKDAIAVVLTPVCFCLNIPYVMPIGTGLVRKKCSVIPLACGTVIYYYIDGIKQNASALAEVVDKNGGATTKFNVTTGQLLGNQEMFAVLVTIVLAALVVNFVRCLKINNAWTLAIISGAVIQFVALLVVYLMMGLTTKIIWLAAGTVIAVIVGFIMRFIFMNLDYARTENVQFEDDEYYYYVKAVPKKMIASTEKVVKHFGNTASLGKRIPRQNKDEVSRNDIVQELNIDDNFFDR